MGRAPCCDKANVKKGPWSPEEDAKLKSYIEQNGTGGNWIALPQKIGLKRCGKSCRLRWLNYLRPNIKHGGFSEEEDSIICSLYLSIGSRWSIIAAQLPGRTDNDIKNYWNTKLKKKILGRQRKELHHQARRSCELKQESSMITTTNEVPYCPEILPVMAHVPYSNQDVRSIHDYTSLRRLLIKLGGRFSSINDESTHQSGSMERLMPFNVMSPPPPNMTIVHRLEGATGYNLESTSSMDALNNPNYQFEHQHFHMGGTGLMDLHQPNDVGQLGFNISSHGMVDGLEFFYGDHEVYNNKNGAESIITYEEDMLAKGPSLVYHTDHVVEDSTTNINSYDQKGQMSGESSSFDEIRYL